VAIVIGLLQIASAFELLLNGGDRALLVLAGLVSVAFGVIMWIHPGAGALALITLIAAFAIVIGTALLVTSFRIRRGSELWPNGSPNRSGQPTRRTDPMEREAGSASLSCSADG
jgi:hypothetical protein